METFEQWYARTWPRDAAWQPDPADPGGLVELGERDDLRTAYLAGQRSTADAYLAVAGA